MTNWLTTSEMAKHLRVSERSLYDLREAHLKAGKHFRRLTPNSKRLLYDVDACEKTLSRLCTTPIEA
tara:strand:+ start:1743 stop:1943 length:201 start_codon:yes stop_codon:yes gene_type:complete